MQVPERKEIESSLGLTAGEVMVGGIVLAQFAGWEMGGIFIFWGLAVALCGAVLQGLWAAYGDWERARRRS